ncbi:restriction endonuclease subunit S [Limosilactobacillus ingluviei]
MYAWEQRKLRDVARYRNGKAHEKDINEFGKYIVVNSKFVSSNGTVRKYSNKMISPLSKGEISFVLSDVPNGKALARTFLIDQDDTYTLNQRIAGILPRQEVNPYFIATLMNRNSYFLKFDDGVGQTNLSKRDVTEWKAFYPSHAEQKKIGIFLEQFDFLIALHQRKPNR